MQGCFFHGKTKKQKDFMNAIESKIQFIKDDDYVYFNEFIYKIFKFKYTKLDQNIF